MKQKRKIGKSARKAPVLILAVILMLMAVPAFAADIEAWR
jgi:hypothetical protein